MEKCHLPTGNQTFCNLFDPLLVFAQSFALGAALCTLFGLPIPSHSADVKLALDNITDIQHSGASRTRASTNNDHQHFAMGSAPPAPNDLAEVKLEVEHENKTDSQHSTESESQTWASELIRLRDAANSQLQKLDNQHTFEIKSWAKISSHVPFAHSASTTPQNHSKDSGPGGTVCTPETSERDNARGTRQTPFLQSGSRRLGGSAKKNINKTTDLAKKKRLTNRPEWRGSTSSCSTSSSASTPHSDSELVVTFTDSSTFVRSCGPELSSMHCASKTADKKQFHVLVDGSYHSAVNDILYNEPVDAGVNDVDSEDQVTAGLDDMHSAKSCTSAVSGIDPRKKERKRRCVPCAKCGQYFGRKSLRRHQALCSLSPQELATKFCCKICGRLSETQRGLSAHMSGFHKILKSKECSICGETFMKWVQVTRHKLATHQVKEHSCHVCGKSYTEKSSLNVHLEVHSGIKRHTCEFCGKQFLRYTTLCDHKVTVHNAGTEVLPCQHCDQTFSTQWHLHQHLGKKHSTGPYFERAKALSLKHSKSETGKQQQTPRWMIKRSNIRCDVCGKTFAFPSVLKKHYESHNERLYQCSVCPRRFRSHKSAARHEQVHNQESKLKCELCGKYLSHQSSFNKHMKLQHSRS